MFPSIFTDELALDFADTLPHLKEWGLKHCDLRGRVFGRAFESLSPEQLADVKKLLDQHGMRIGCLQSSLAKVHLPDQERQAAEAEKLEGILRAADALDCRLVRAFFYWQPPPELAGALAIRPDEQQKVLDMFAPLAERAKAAGLLLAFENCGVTPDEVFVLLDALGVPAWGLAWDCCNTWNCDERRADENAFVIRMAQRARCVHVKATGAVAGTADELIPYDKVLQICDNAGIQGPVSAETHNPDRSVDNVEMSRRTVEVIQKAWPTAAPGGLFDTKKSEGLVRPWADDPVRFVVVGLGMGHSRSKLIKATSGTELVGVCDLVEERVQRTAEECDVPGSTDLTRWLDDDSVEAVYVLTETGNHAEVALQALDAGKHVLSTKPMEASLAACDAMIRLAEEKGLTLAVDFSRRIEPGPLAVKAAIDAGKLGHRLSAEASLKILRTMDYFNSNGGWRGTRRWDGGGVLSNQNIHHIDELAFCFGIPSQVRCSIWTQDHDIEAEDLGAATWLYDDGFVLSMYATSCYPHSTWYFRLEAHGTEGALSRAAGGPLEKPFERWFLDGAWGDKAPVPAVSDWTSCADNFAAHLRTGAPLVCTGRDGRRTQATLDAMYRSAYDHDGGWVNVDAELP
ncbi:MAG: Gfo/Idh/MocA family oxidoreductase [Candidatus Brocadiae bacterium]|nr:Gfo/Idh/MocA family oxidoreductase [Candidatus Brocadiia bacterium]